MATKRLVLTMVIFTAGLLFVVKILQDTSYFLKTRSEQTEQSSKLARMLMDQRNNISRLLNLKQQKLGQIECEKIKSEAVATSETGGWCSKSSTETGGNHMTDMKLVPALIEFLSGKYIGSFGDGPGRYKQLIQDSGKVEGYDAYDGAPFCTSTSEGRVQFLDLTLPQYGLPLYDWIVSLEVAEHIPQKYEAIYIDNVVRHAREGVILSWAVPGQGGYSHVNNRPFDYVKALMESFEFVHDEISSTKLRNASSFGWFKNNINVFRRKQIGDPLEFIYVT